MRTATVHIPKALAESIAVRVVGTSMHPTLLDGDVVLVDPSRSTKDGSIVAVHIHGQGRIVGRFRQSPAGAWIEKDNRAFPPVFLGRGEGFTVLGVVVMLVDRDVSGREDLPAFPGIPAVTTAHDGAVQ